MNQYNPFRNRRSSNMVMASMKPYAQLIIESQNEQDRLKNYIRDFISEYDTNNMVIGMYNHTPLEIVEGYFEVTFASHDLETALKYMNIGESMQILGREGKDRIYRNGIIYNILSECSHESIIVNIKTLEQLDFNDIDESLVTEGAMAGHMYHIMDYSDMTCDDICDLVRDMFGGNVIDITEKIDGMNLQASMNNAGEVIFIRNKGDINSERGGFLLGDMISRWADKAHVRNTMTSAGEVIQQVCKKLGMNFFNPDPETRLFLNCEAVIAGKTNIIPYSSQQVDFHDIFVYKLTDNGWELEETTKRGLSKVNDACRGIDSAQITPEIIIKVTEKSAQLEQQYIKAFQKLWDDSDLSYNTSIDEYKYYRFCKYMKKKYPWVLDNSEGCRFLYERIINKTKLVNIRALRGFWPGHDDELSEMDKGSENIDITRYVVKHLDDLFIRFGNAIIKLCDGFINKADAGVIDRLADDLEATLKEIEKTGDEKTKHKVAIQMQRLCRGDKQNIVINNAEGIVFNYKGRTMKITGSFAPLNAILGMKYNL